MLSVDQGRFSGVTQGVKGDCEEQSQVSMVETSGKEQDDIELRDRRRQS